MKGIAKKLPGGKIAPVENVSPQQLKAVEAEVFKEQPAKPEVTKGQPEWVSGLEHIKKESKVETTKETKRLRQNELLEGESIGEISPEEASSVVAREMERLGGDVEIVETGGGNGLGVEITQGKFGMKSLKILLNPKHLARSMKNKIKGAIEAAVQEEIIHKEQLSDPKTGYEHGILWRGLSDKIRSMISELYPNQEGQSFEMGSEYARMREQIRRGGHITEWFTDDLAKRTIAMDLESIIRKEGAKVEPAEPKAVVEAKAVEVKPPEVTPAVAKGEAEPPVEVGKEGVDLEKPSTPEGGTNITATMNSKLLGDLSKGKTSFSETYNLLDVPTRQAVDKGMIALIHDNKVFNSIVSRIPVDMMNDLAGKKISPNNLLHDKTMLLDALSSKRSINVAPFIFDLIITSPASARAKMFLRSLNPLEIAQNNLSAINAGDLNRVEIGSQSTRGEIALQDISPVGYANTGIYKTKKQKASKKGEIRARTVQRNQEVSAQEPPGIQRVAGEEPRGTDIQQPKAGNAKLLAAHRKVGK
jgi:hypothetical protein